MVDCEVVGMFEQALCCEVEAAGVWSNRLVPVIIVVKQTVVMTASDKDS